MKPAQFFPVPYRMLPLAALLALLFGAPAAHAQARPDAGQAIGQIERAPLALPPRQTLDINLPDEGTRPAAPADGTRLTVRAFRFAGNTAIPDEDLEALLSDLARRELTLAELQAGARRVTQLYRERGYPLARAWLPQQEIADGVVRIEVLEGRYGEVRIDNQAGLNDTALAPLAALEAGGLVRASPLERSLLLARELPGVEVKSTLRPGASVGTTDLEIEVLRGPGVSGNVEADNFGSRYTGQYRLGGTLYLNNPLGLGDRLSLRALGSDEGQAYGRLAYDAPLGSWGTRLGLGWSQMNYELAREFDDLDAHGTARIASAWAVQPLVRSRAFSLYFALQFDGKRLTDEIDLFSSEIGKRARVWTATLSGNGSDDWLGGGLSSFALAASSGRLFIADAAARQLDGQSARTHGSFAKFNPSVARLQRLAGPFSVFAQVEGQWADGNLDSAEKLVLGGAYGVRAYPQGEAAGDEGWLARLELRYDLSPAWQASLFADHGEIRLNRKPWAEGDKYRALAGAGLGVSWASGGWRVQASAAWKTDGGEADSGPDRHPRLWARVGRDF